MDRQQDLPLLRRLQRYAQGPVLPMHMPGHMRNTGLLGHGLPYDLDVTELEEFGALHQYDGALGESMRMAAQTFGVRRTFYLVNGSSCGLLAGVRALTRRGDKVLVARNCHIAVYHALELCGLRPVYVHPPVDARFGISASLPVERVERALSEHPDIRLMALTSPTYEGVVSDVQAIADALHRRGAALLVDEAHGAHLPFSGAFPQSAVRCGADVVVQSVHKTLAGLTQTALLHLVSGRADEAEIERQLRIFETSSPSYVLMASLDACVRQMREEGQALMAAYARRLRAFDERVVGLRRLRVLCHGADALNQHPLVFAHDPGKILVSGRAGGLSGNELQRRLLAEANLQMEMSLGDCTLAMTSFATPSEGFDRLADALAGMDASLPDAHVDEATSVDMPEPELALPIEQALYAPGERLALAACEGRVAREYVYAYPPGIPVLVPGERVSARAIQSILAMDAAGALLRSDSGQAPQSLLVAGETVKFGV